MSAVPAPYCSPKEYLERERAAAARSEYIAGEILAMSGASYDHNRITANLVATLHGQLRGGPCNAVANDLRVQAGEKGAFFYPDVVVICGDPVFSADEQPDTITNPTVLIEVLSPSTEAYDRGLKFAWYRRIPTLREYILVSQTEPLLERYRRDGSDWVFTEFRGITDVAQLSSIGCILSLADVYDRIPLLSGSASNGETAD